MRTLEQPRIDETFDPTPQLANLCRYVHNNPVNAIDPSGLVTEAGLRSILLQLQLAPEASKLYDDAKNAVAADKLSLQISTEQSGEVQQPNASNMKTGAIWIDKNDSRCNVIETLLVELSHMSARKDFINIVDNAKKLTRDEFIRKEEEFEFKSVQRAAAIWKSSSQKWNCTKACPTYGDPDDVLKMTFEDQWKKLKPEHKEQYGQYWDLLQKQPD